MSLLGIDGGFCGLVAEPHLDALHRIHQLN